MNQVWTILRAKLRIAHNGIASVRNESKLKVGVISVSAVLLWLGAFFFFHASFEWLLRFGKEVASTGQAIGDIIMVRMLSVFSLSIFIMLIFSNLLVSFSTLYRSREVAYLIQAPIQFRDFFLARFVECVIFSSWALAFLGSPLLLAYGMAKHAPLIFYAASILFFLPFVTLPAAIGTAITIFLARIFTRLNTKVIVALAIIAVGVLFLYLHKTFNAKHLSEDNMLPFLLDATTQTQSPLFPSYWVSRGVLSASVHNYSDCCYYLLLLTSNALMAVWLVSELAHRLFYPGWSSLNGQERSRLRPSGKGILGKLDILFPFLRNPERVLTIKDIRLFWRDPTQWSQFVVFFGIMAIYIANLRNTSKYYEQEFWRSWIACLNNGACTLILSTLTSRFVFPLVSLEGRRFWILGLAPLSYRQLVWQKFWLSVCTTSFFTVSLVMLSGWMLKLETIYFSLSIYSIIITNFGLAGLAVGLGALYPNFEEDNPARIVSGMGGTLNFLLSTGYIALVVGAQTLILQWRVLQRYTSPDAFQYALGGVLVFITLLSLLAVFAPMYFGLRNLKNMEY